MRIVQSFADSGPRLYICSTPIGNLQDTSQRLIEVLKTADVVAAEDTRQTRKLLTHFDIHPAALVSYHQHNRASRERDFEAWWSEGRAIALVSDAGTPGVSDPGDDAVQLALRLGVPVVPVPGASAVLAALVCSGFQTQPFTFIGFLPRDKKAAKDTIAPYESVPGALVVYESPHRLLPTLRLLADALPTRPVTLAKELTKRHETFVYAESALELVARFEELDVRGEYVIVVGPAPESVRAQKALEDEAERMLAARQRVAELLQQGVSHAAAVKETARQFGVRRNDLYQITLNM